MDKKIIFERWDNKTISFSRMEDKVNPKPTRKVVFTSFGERKRVFCRWDENPILRRAEGKELFKRFSDNEITSDEQFKDWAQNKLKIMHGDKYDQSIADKTISDLLEKYGKDYGAMIGAINKSNN